MRQDPSDDSHFAAVEAVNKMVRDDPDAAWSVILELIQRAEDDRMLASIAAGPLEDLIVLHGPAVIDRIEAQAAADRRFLRTLTGVWYRSGMAEDVERRILLLTRDEPGL